MDNSPQDERQDSIVMSAGDQYTATLSRTSMRTLFHMFSGNTDSITRAYSGPVLIEINDLQELYNNLQEKLENHHLEAVTLRMDFVYNNGKILTLNSFTDLKDCRWDSPETTKSITMKWDFLVSLPRFNIPQRHIINVKITNELKAEDIFGMIAGAASGKIQVSPSELMKNMPTVTCRVDFINTVLGEEILNLVERWHKTRRTPIRENGYLNLLKKNSRIIRLLLQYPIYGIFVTALVFLFQPIVKNMDFEAPMSSGYFIMVVTFLMLFFAGSYATKRLGRMLSSTFNEHINKIGMFWVFRITQGDCRHGETLNIIEKSEQKFITLHLTFGFLFNVIASMVAAMCFELLKF